MTTVTGKVLSISGAPFSPPPTITFVLQNYDNDQPRVAGTSEIFPPAPFVITCNTDGTFSASIYGNDQITPAGTSYRVTVSAVGSSYTSSYVITGASFDLDSATPLGSSPIVAVIPSATLSVSPTAPGNFTVAHGLGRTPVGVLIMMTSSGTIWFQSPTMFDNTNLYLVASEPGVTAKVEVW